MAKLYFKFGAMGSSKTAQALMTKFNYEEKGKNVWIMKPSIDTRETEVTSRIGLHAPAYIVSPDENLLDTYRRDYKKIDVIIVDECQFLTEAQVDQLRVFVDEYGIPVLCFGLRADFQAKLFPGSKRLFEIADSITEIKSICSCGRKAIVNVRFDDSGEIITEGDQVCIGGNDRYVGMCYKCYMERKKAHEAKLKLTELTK